MGEIKGDEAMRARNGIKRDIIKATTTTTTTTRRMEMIEIAGEQTIHNISWSHEQETV